MKYYNPNYDRYLEQYGFGSWLQKNAGTIGTIAGAVGATALTATGVGAAFAPGLMAATSSLGNAVSGNYEQGQQAEQMQQQLQQQQLQNKINIASSKISANQQEFAGLNRFGLGGGLSSPNAESLFIFHATDPATGRRAIPRDLTSTSQDLVKKLPMFESGMFNPIYANDMHNFYGKRDDGSIGYINTTKQFTGNDKARYADHLDALRERESYMENYQLPNPNKPSLPDKLEARELGGNLYPNQSTTNGTGINSYPLRNLKYAMGGSLTKYAGQDHSTGRDGGIKVDQNGSPTATTGNQAVGLVEDGEVSYTHPETKQVYIFSKKIPYTI